MIEKLRNINNITNEEIYDYKDIFYEETNKKNYIFLNSKLDKISSGYTNGISITIKDNDIDYFIATNKFEDCLLEYAKIKSNFKNNNNYVNSDLDLIYHKTEKSHSTKSDDDKLSLLKMIDNFCRNKDKRINQVKITIQEKLQKKHIVINNILNIEEVLYTRLSVVVTAKENGIIVNNSYSPGYTTDYDFLDISKLKLSLDEICEDLLLKLIAVPYKGGKVPVILNKGFGAVLFHEACGHAMESYSIVDKTSILTDKLNKKIGSDKLTIIDDGTIQNLYGTTTIDDQGVKTQKNILIENGVLLNYLTDIKDANVLNSKSTGSARRESYQTKAISRMNNTYLLPGSDKVEDMIKSIDHGIYAKTLGGGSVSPATGEFNFFVNFGFIIENGKLTDPIKDVTLTGSIFEVLENIEMVSDDLAFGTGVCGAESGNVEVTCGQPTVKVKKILVGGNNV